jgi:hypothetical protein
MVCLDRSLLALFDTGDLLCEHGECHRVLYS